MTPLPIEERVRQMGVRVRTPIPTADPERGYPDPSEIEMSMVYAFMSQSAFDKIPESAPGPLEIFIGKMIKFKPWKCDWWVLLYTIDAGKSFDGRQLYMNEYIHIKIL